MNWKDILLQIGTIFVCVFISVRLFIPAGSSQSEQIQLLSDQIQRVESQLKNLERKLSVQQADSSHTSNQPSRIDEINLSLRAIKESLARLENKNETPRRLESPIGSTPPAGRTSLMRPPTGTDPAAWIGGLSPEKRAKVQEIFNQHAEIMRAKLPRDEQPPDPETMKRVLQESDRELKENMKAALDAKEYQQFLNSLPRLPGTGSPTGPVSRSN